MMAPPNEPLTITNLYIALQMVGKRSSLKDIGRWGSESPRTELVMIAPTGGIDDDAMRAALDACIGDSDLAMLPMLRLARKIAPDLLTEHRPEGRELRKPTRWQASERR